MLSAIRNSRKLLAFVLWFVIAAFVSTIFVVWGIGENDNTQNYVAKVGDKVITYAEYDNTLSQIQSNELFNIIQIDNIEAGIVENLVAEKLLDIEGERLNIPVSDIEVALTIRNEAVFQKDGKFDADQYLTLLASNRISVEKYEESVRANLRRSKLEAMLLGSQSVVSDKEIEQELNYRKSLVNIDYLDIPLSKFNNNINVSDDELTAYYEKVKNNYKEPVRSKFKYIVFNKGDFDKTITITEEEAKKFYESNKDLYKEKKSADISRIDIPVDNFDNKEVEAKAKEKAQAALNELKQGASFQDVASKYNPENAKDAHVGIVSEGELVPELEKAVFSLSDGKYSEIIKTPISYTIVYVNKINSEKTYSFEEKKDDIVSALKEMKSASGFKSYVISQYKEIATAGNIAGYLAGADNKDVTVLETGFMSENEPFPIPIVETNQKFHKTLFNLQKNEISQSIDDGVDAYIFEVTARENSKIPALSEVKNKVKESLIREKLEKSVIEELAKETASGLDKAASKYGVSIMNAGFTRESINREGAADVEDVYNTLDMFSKDTALSDEVKAASTGSIIKPHVIGDSVYVLKISKITPPKNDFTDTDKESVKEYISSVKTAAASTGYIESLKAKIPVKYNEVFLKSQGIQIPKNTSK